MPWVSANDGTGRSRDYPSKSGLTWGGNRNTCRFEFGHLSQDERFHPRGPLSFSTGKPRKSFPHAQLINILHDPIRQTPLSFEDLDRKLFGLQYHPESFLSNQGTQIISNILDESMA